MRFTNTLWYEEVDLEVLAQRVGVEAMESLLFHVVAFEINKLCSLKPETLDWGALHTMGNTSV